MRASKFLRGNNVSQSTVKGKKKKDPLRVAMGKRNRRSGKTFERNVLARLISFGLSVFKTPMSGSLKASGLIPCLKDHMASDLQIQLKDNTYLVECKHMSTHEKLFNELPDVDCYHYKGFCYMMSDDAFLSYLCGGKINIIEKEDKRNKWLHNFFNQDNSHIVVLGYNYRDNIYCVREDVYDIFYDCRKMRGK